jgi:predicted transcriptional regulator
MTKEIIGKVGKFEEQKDGDYIFSMEIKDIDLYLNMLKKQTLKVEDLLFQLKGASKTLQKSMKDKLAAALIVKSLEKVAKGVIGNGKKSRKN